MIGRLALLVLGLVLGFASPCRSEVIGLYDARKLAAEGARLESRTKELWNLMYEKLLHADEKAALQRVQLRFPTMAPKNNVLNFVSYSDSGIIDVPLHSLLLLEEICLAYAWLHLHGYDVVTINEYAALLKYGRRVPPPLEALGIPGDALMDEEVAALSLRFRNSAYAFALAHEAGHILLKHPGNKAVSPEVSRGQERAADKFSVRVLQRDKQQIPMGAILLFQMTAFVASPGRFDFPTAEEWHDALRKEDHPLTSDRVRGVVEVLREDAAEYGKNREIALDVAGKLETIAKEMDDHDWHMYFKRIGEQAPLTTLRPKRKE